MMLSNGKVAKMPDKWLEEIREKISCPQLGDEHYGEWGILTKHQRFTIKRMLDFIESQEAYINRLRAENERLKHESDVSIEDIHSLSDQVNELIEENERLKLTPKCVYAYNGETVEWCVEGPCSAERLVETIKAEAYKDFAEKVKKLRGNYTGYAFDKKFDNLLKELTEKSN